jgi:eukaryotic-like serine/threonine-protein kinase
VTYLVGRRLGNFEVLEEIGRGGMARVFRAVDTRLGRMVALKVMAAQLSLDPEFVRRFEREARTAASLRHPAIVTIYDVGEHDGFHFIAMEYINGRTLHAVIEERGALGLAYAVPLLAPLGQALDYAHTQGAVHRDIKPHNVLIDVDGRVLLTDFGIAQTNDEKDERLTRTGVFMGTPEYISPEQAEARRVDGRSDLYSLGIVAYEIITGRVPFSGATPQLIVAHAQQPPPPPSSLVAYLPSDLDTVFGKTLAKSPQSRYPNGAALVDALRGVAQRSGTTLATREQIAALARRSSTSAGLPTTAINRDATPKQVPVLPPKVAPVARTPVPSPRTIENRDFGVSAQSNEPRIENPSQRQNPGRRAPAIPQRGRNSVIPYVVAGTALALLVALLISVLMPRNTNGETIPTSVIASPTVGPATISLPTEAPPPTNTIIILPTNTSLPPEIQTVLVTTTPLPATDTAEPTSTSAPRPTSRPTSPPQPTPTDILVEPTPIPLTDTPEPPTPILEPTAIPEPPTATPEPPTATATVTPTIQADTGETPILPSAIPVTPISGT